MLHLVTRISQAQLTDKAVTKKLLDPFTKAILLKLEKIERDLSLLSFEATIRTSCLFVCLFVCLFACLLACLLVCLFVCLLASWYCSMCKPTGCLEMEHDSTVTRLIEDASNVFKHQMLFLALFTFLVALLRNALSKVGVTTRLGWIRKEAAPHSPWSCLCNPKASWSCCILNGPYRSNPLLLVFPCVRESFFWTHIHLSIFQDIKSSQITMTSSDTVLTMDSPSLQVLPRPGPGYPYLFYYFHFHIHNSMSFTQIHPDSIYFNCNFLDLEPWPT